MVVAVAITALTLLDTKNVAARHLAAAALRAPCERQLINAVRAANPPGERSRLIATRIRGELYLWYGDPDPSGRIPFGIHGYRNYQDGHPTEARAIYRIIGTACNYYMKAADRFPFAGTWAGCDTWHPDKADRVAARYARCRFHVTAIWRRHDLRNRFPLSRPIYFRDTIGAVPEADLYRIDTPSGCYRFTSQRETFVSQYRSWAIICGY